MKKAVSIFFLAVVAYCNASAMVCNASTEQDSTYTKTENRGIFAAVKKFVRGFSHVDTNYIEPQKYNLQIMLQNTNTYEQYTVWNSNGQRINFAPEPTVKIGPYFGWRFLFLGYTIDIHNLVGNSKKEFDVSLYSSQLGFDLFWRKTGNDYKIKSITLDGTNEISEMNDVPFSGFEASIKGFNLYYICNHNKFSYPAAFSQSTKQQKSCGSLMFGIGYTKQTLAIDWDAINSLIQEKVPVSVGSIDSSLITGKVEYSDFCISMGYGYNWVFAKNWLFAASISAGLGYKYSKSDTQYKKFRLHDFSLKNFNIDGIGRFGLVWNNSHWFAGSSIILHAYNYHKKKFSTNTMFGSMNIYMGVNLWRK